MLFANLQFVGQDWQENGDSDGTEAYDDVESDIAADELEVENSFGSPLSRSKTSETVSAEVHPSTTMNSCKQLCIIFLHA